MAINQDASSLNGRLITTPESSDVMMMTYGASELTFPVSLVAVTMTVVIVKAEIGAKSDKLPHDSTSSMHF